MTRKTNSLSRLGALAFLLLCVVCLSALVGAQSDDPTPTVALAGDYFDNLIPARLASDHIAGAVVVVVQGDVSIRAPYGLDTG